MMTNNDGIQKELLSLVENFDINSWTHMEITFYAISKYLIKKMGIIKFEELLAYSSFPDSYKHIEQWLEIDDKEKFKRYLGILGSEYNRHLLGG